MTDSDLLRKAGEALNNDDHAELSKLRDIAADWVMDQHDQSCLLHCLDSMISAAEELEGRR